MGAFSLIVLINLLNRRMVRVRKRYSICDLKFISKRPFFNITPSVLTAAVLNAVRQKEGDVGYARVKPSLRCVYCNQLTKTFILFYDRDSVSAVESSISYMDKLAGNCTVLCKLLHSSHTAKQAHKFLAKYQRDFLLRQRQTTADVDEKRLIMKQVRELNEKLMEAAQRGFDFDTA